MVLWWHPPEIADGRRRVRDAEEFLDRGRANAAYGTILGHDRAGRRGTASAASRGEQHKRDQSRNRAND